MFMARGLSGGGEVGKGMGDTQASGKVNKCATDTIFSMHKHEASPRPNGLAPSPYILTPFPAPP